MTVAVDGSGDVVGIQEGIDMVASGDTVLVRPGVYQEHVNFMGKALLLISSDGPIMTTIEGSDTPGPVVTISSGESRWSAIEGFTIKGGTGHPQHGGGGIYAMGASVAIRNNHVTRNSASWGGGILAGRLDLGDPPSLTIESNVIDDNTAVHGGGGLMLYSANAYINDNEVTNNRNLQGDGGGISAHINVGVVTVTRNLLIANQAGDKGGGMHGFTERSFGGGPLVISWNLFSENVALGEGDGDSGSGGGLCLVDVSGLVQNNTIVANSGYGESACGGGGIKIRQTAVADLDVSRNIIALNENCGLACWNGGLANVSQNLFWENELSDIASAEGGCPTLSHLNYFVDPMFCNPAGGDFSVAESSPALGGEVPMGAYVTPGCQRVAVRPSSWGQIKLRSKQKGD